MTRKTWTLVALLALLGIGGVLLFRPSTPQGVNVAPLVGLELGEGYRQIERVKEKLRGEFYEQNTHDGGTRLIIPRRQDGAIYRSIELHQFQKREGALEEYLSYRATFTEGLSRRLYLERGSQFERYFISYATTRFDTNHGIPMGIITAPEILIGVLKQNLFVSVSYSSYRSRLRWGLDYVPRINEDIEYARDLLE